MKRIKRHVWLPALVLLFPLLIGGLSYIPWIVDPIWDMSEPLRLQHTELTGINHKLQEYRWLAIRVSAWNACLFSFILWLIIRNKPLIIQRLVRWWNEPVSYGQLAVYRLVVYGGLLALVIQNHPASMSLLPDELQDPPIFWGWIQSSWFFDPTTVALMSLLAQATSIAAILGFQGSLSAKIATFSACYVLLIPQSYGKVDHYHLLWWASLILAWSPAWKVWSIDAWVAASKGETSYKPIDNSSFKGLFWLGLLIITAYTFPGIWKWAWNGPLWASPDSMKSIAWNQWAVLPEPPLWQPGSDWVWMMLSSWVLIFELTFPLILLGVNWRKAYIIMGFCFHLGVFLTLGIAFWHLAILLLLIWPINLPDGSTKSYQPQVISWKSAWAWVVGAFVFCGMVYLDTWPVGVYPGFSAALSQKIQTITLKKNNRVVWEMYQSPWGVGNRKLNPSRKMGIVTQIIRAKGEKRKMKLHALRSFLATGPDSVLFKDETMIFDLDLKNSRPIPTN